MLPKPSFEPKSFRLPVRKRMTVVIGLKNNDSVVIAADREENDSYLRNDVGKIRYFTLRNGWHLGLGGAGNSAFIDYSFQQIEERLNKAKSLSSATVREQIEDELLSIHTRHIFPATNCDREFALVISAHKADELCLFKTDLASVTAGKDKGFFCIGAGSGFALSLLNKYWGVYSTRGAVILALHVAKETKRYVRDVGGGTDIFVQLKSGKIGILTRSLTAPLEKMLEDLDSEFEGAFFGAMSLTQWEATVAQFQANTSTNLRGIEREIDRLFKAFKLE